MARKNSKGINLKTGEYERKDGRYEYRWTDQASGKRQTIYANSLVQLREKELDIERDIFDGIRTSAENKKMTLNNAFDRHMSILQIENSTRSNYIGLWSRHVVDNIGTMKVVDIKPSHIKKYYAELTTQGFAWGTLKLIHGILVPIFDQAVEDDVIRKNPAKGNLSGYGVKPKEKEALSINQQQRLFSYLEKNSCYACYIPMLTVFISTACRVGEISGLTWEQIDYETGEIRIDHQLIYKNYGDGCKFHLSTPKTDAGVRSIPINATLKKALLEQRKIQLLLGISRDIEVEGLSGFVFTSKNGKPLAPNAFNNILYNIVEVYNKDELAAAKKEHRLPELLPKFSAHVLRHTGCTRMAEAGINPKVLQYVMGHADSSITMNVYNHIAERELVKEEMKKMDKVI